VKALTLSLSALAVAAPLAAALAETGPPTFFDRRHGLLRPASMSGLPDGGRIDRLRHVFPAVRACWEPPSSGGEVTFRFSFRRDGAMLGEPRLTYASGDGEAREKLIASVKDAFSRCLPLPFTDGFGGAVAGRPFTIRFVDERRD
jgi:hypothetical protein